MGSQRTQSSRLLHLLQVLSFSPRKSMWCVNTQLSQLAGNPFHFLGQALHFVTSDMAINILAAACILTVAVTVSVNASSPMFALLSNDVTESNESNVIDALRRRLVAVSDMLRYTRPLAASVTYKQLCSCEEYCTGRCFSMMCSPCTPGAFSFPGGEGLCLNVGPLGTGLLCHVDPQSGNITENACCSEDGPTCWLPQGSCCATGDCGTCPTDHYPNNLTNLYPPLRRVFTNNTCKSAL